MMLGKLLNPLFEPALIRLFVFLQSRDMKSGNPKVRAQHAKHQGCVWGEFKVLEDLPDDVRTGIFSTARSYATVIRFSTGVSFDDREDDVRGMAIKLIGVSGTKRLSDESTAETQDFILSDHPTFFAANLMQFLRFAAAAKRGTPFDQLSKSFPAFKGMAKPAQDSPLVAQYWSQTPYKLGQRVVKYAVTPAPTNALSDCVRESANFLQENMSRRLEAGQADAHFDFHVQLPPDDSDKWINDPTLDWDQQSSPSTKIKVARITIHPQEFDTDEQRQFCEDLCYTPWHCLPEHAPLGQINRIRRAAYAASSTVRHQATSAAGEEPTSRDVPSWIDIEP